MKKISIAAALVFCAVTASAQVGISGKVGIWTDNNKVGASSTNTIVSDPTSNFAITAVEKLGGGLTARAVVESSMNGNTIGGTGTQLGDRQGTVGISSAIGSLDLGRNVHSQFLAITGNDAFDTLYGSVAGDVHNLRGLRFSNGAFASLKPVKGITVNIDRSQQSGAEANAYSIAGKIGPVSATVARYTSGAETSEVIAGNIALGATTVFYSHSDDRGVVKSKGDLIGARHQLGAITVKASVGQTDRDIKAYSVGADYAFSKRTQAGVAVRKVNLAGTAHDVEQLGVGLTHRF